MVVVAMDLSPTLRILACVFMMAIQFASGNFVFNVTHKFAGKDKQLSELKSHDTFRHARMLANVDLPLGGDSRADSIGLYFTKIQLGSPPKYYHVQVDTGSDILWVNCAPCSKCPVKTDLGIPLSLYDSKASSTSKKVWCDDGFCSLISQSDTCEPEKKPCSYHVVYGDGSTSDGDFVKDNITLDQVTGNLRTSPLAQQVVFGCGSNQSGQLGQTDSAVDGIMGFGQANTSIISQLAAAGNVKRVFSHCLDNVNGGGIFAVGEVESPVVKTTPLVPNQVHYNVILKGIDVDGEPVDLPPSIASFGGNGGTIIDSGTTLAYLPENLYNSLLKKITARQPVKLHTVQETFACFSFTTDTDKAFPVVNLHFEDSLKMTIYPHDYLFSLRQDMYCFGWQSGGLTTQDGSDVILLGDLVLSNKLVVYDLDNEVIGWVDHNCSSSIKVKDGTGAAYSLGADNLVQSASSIIDGTLVPLLSILISVFYIVTS
ncbi:Eukaryotic aspartyl protease family protein [Raphanus sativus]|uniref:Aspartic proteinase 36 n=1 Tax=Raphanus sativus TaxID=3726 RepID=A0A6J0LE67_RAPSA|nr:aspartic proteinase 36 [Raphanus sativus]XP_018458159.1 aspartic proteinase 36 [Raphanus sativus]KAJ4902187.1 Eukaryotic aspartyl protease family protein [Raphanus sativus]